MPDDLKRQRPTITHTRTTDAAIEKLLIALGVILSDPGTTNIEKHDILVDLRRRIEPHILTYSGLRWENLKGKISSPRRKKEKGDTGFPYTEFTETKI